MSGLRNAFRLSTKCCILVTYDAKPNALQDLRGKPRMREVLGPTPSSWVAAMSLLNPLCHPKPCVSIRVRDKASGFTQ